MKADNVEELQDFVDELSKYPPEKIDVPGFSIPDFPEEVEVKMRLGWRSFLLPIRSKDTELMVLKKCTAYLWFGIDKKGIIGFSGKIPFVPAWNRFKCDSSDTFDPFLRIQSIVLFDQFKEEMFGKTIRSLKLDTDSQKELVAHVTRAFEPFIPYHVANKLK